MTAEDPNILAIRQRLARATAAMHAIALTEEADTGKYKYKYATLTDVLQNVKSALAAESLVLLQPILTRDGMMVVTTMVLDTITGNYIMFDGPGCAVKADPQAAGSAITYFRRYALTSMFGLEVADDDGAQAHRAAVNPEGRTQAEIDARAIVARLSDEDKRKHRADFVEEFGCTLTNLPESRHGDALAFVKFWTAPPEPTETATAEDASEGAS